MPEPEKALPCPFCGEKPRTWFSAVGQVVVCDDTNCAGSVVTHIERWNRRSPGLPPSGTSGEPNFTILNAADFVDEYTAREPLRTWGDYETAMLRNFSRWLAIRLKRSPDRREAPDRTAMDVLTERATLYDELIYAVGNKYPGETRHQTALRYIRQAEEPRGDAGAATKAAHPAAPEHREDES